MPRKSRKNVGLIGIGIIGSRVATGLRAAGFQVFVWNRTAKPVPNFLGSPAEVAAMCDVIQIFVSDSAALLSVIEAMRGELTPQHVVACHATVGPEAVGQAARLVTQCGAKFLDAPFTGSRLAAERRQLVYYIGGEEATFLRVKPVLEASSRAIIRIGDIGHASTVKVATNMISAVTTQVLAEALAIVEQAGLDPEVLAAAIEQNACRSGITDLKLPKMIAGDYEPHFSLKHMFKDVQLGIQMANTLDIEIPATTVAAGVMYGALNQGWADLDFSALYKVYSSAVPEPETPALESRPMLEVPEPAVPPEAKPAQADIDERAASAMEAATPEAEFPAPPPVAFFSEASGPTTDSGIFPAADPDADSKPAPIEQSKTGSEEKKETGSSEVAGGGEAKSVGSLETVLAELASESTHAVPAKPAADDAAAPGEAGPVHRPMNFLRRWFVSGSRG